MIRFSPLILVLVLLAASASASTLVVANKSEATVSLIDLTSGEVVATLPTGEGPHEVGLSPDGRRALVTNYGNREKPGSSLTLIDIAAAKVVKTINLGEYRRPHGIEWLDDGHAAVTCEDNKALITVNVEKSKVTRTIDTDQDTSHMVSLTADGKRAFVANIGSGSVTAIDLAGAKRISNIATGDGAEGVAVAAGQVWITNRGADTVTVLDATSLEEIKSFESKGFPIRATAAGQGRVLVTRPRGGDMAIYKTDGPELERVMEFDLKAADLEGRLFGGRFGDSSMPIGVVVDNEGKRAYVAHANADVITEVDVEKGKILRILTAGREPDGMAYSEVDVKKP